MSIPAREFHDILLDIDLIFAQKESHPDLGSIYLGKLEIGTDGSVVMVSHRLDCKEPTQNLTFRIDEINCPKAISTFLKLTRLADKNCNGLFWTTGEDAADMKSEMIVYTDEMVEFHKEDELVLPTIEEKLN